jgi:FkbM family methyltransferase
MINKIIKGYNQTKGRVKHNVFFCINSYLSKIKINFKYVVEVDGYKFIFEKIEDGTNIWEYLKNYYNINNIKNKDVIVDIGANIGDFSIFTSKKAKQIYSFEPLPHIYKKMKTNIKLNKIKNIKTYNLTISDKDGYIKMDNQQNSVLSKLDDNGTLNVKTISWDTLNKMTPKKIDLLKIDIEGGEYTLLKQPKILNKVEEIRMELHINDQKDKTKCL